MEGAWPTPGGSIPTRRSAGTVAVAAGASALVPPGVAPFFGVLLVLIVVERLLRFDVGGGAQVAKRGPHVRELPGPVLHVIHQRLALRRLVVEQLVQRLLLAVVEPGGGGKLLPAFLLRRL